ncbi:MAG: dihydromethanopterin reductase (acceptor) [Methanotrichaceae archaeon]
MKNIAWAVTGAGHCLAESIIAMQELSQKNRVCTFVSRAGEEVSRMYGHFDRLSDISNGEYMKEIFLESEEGSSSPKTGRFMMGKFDLLIIAPATANTVAKMACGIADSLVTNAAALANKAGIPIFVLPTDVKENAQTQIPYIIERELCRHCEVCKPREECPHQAIDDQIDLMKCNGCGICVELCEYGAIRGGIIPVVTRELDKINIERLKTLQGFTVLESAEEIRRII